MDISETPSTSQHRSSFEEIFTPINKITQAISAKDLKIVGNEALTLYTKLETDKLQMHAKELNKTCIKLEEQTAQILKQQKELAASNEESRKSLALQSKTLLILQTQYESFKTKIEEQCNTYKTTYKEYAEKYKKAERVYETYHPRYKHLKELEIESRKKEIEYTMLKQKISEENKRIALRYEIQRKMFHCSIVKFVQAVVIYWNARDLSLQLKEAEKREQELIQELQDLELLVAKKKRERQLAEKNAAAAKQSPTPQFKLPAVTFPPPPPASTALYPLSSFTKYTPTNSQETLLHMRNKLEQRKQEWSQRHSFSSNLSNKRPYTTDHSVEQKRRLLQINTPAQNQIFNYPKINILDVKTFKPLKLGNIKENLMPPKIASHGTSQQMMSSQSQTEENSKSIQRPLVNINNHFSERMLQMQPNNALQKTVHALPQLEDITKIVSTTSFSVDKIASQDLSRYPSQASQKCFPSSYSQQSNISLPSAIKQTSSQEMIVQFSQTGGNRDNIFFQPQTQEENTMLTSITHKNISEIMPHTLPALQEQKIFSPQSQNNGSSLNENKFAIPKTSTTQLQYRSQIAPSQSQAGASLQDNIQTQGTATESCAFSDCGVTQNLNHMLLAEHQPEQNKGPDDSGGTSQSSTFSQKCQQLSEILAKELPEMECEVTSAPMTNPSTTAVITSPFFNKTKAMDTVDAEDNNTMQAPLQMRKDTMFAGKSIEELLDNSALFHDQEMPTESSFIEENQPLFSPDYSMNAEPDLNMQPGQSSAFSFNFQQPQSAPPNETKSFFSTASGLFNMFS